MNTDTDLLAKTSGFNLLGSVLGKEVESALQVVLSGGAVFAEGQDALAIFRQVLAASIRSIESHPRGKLFQEFLRKGPYENAGKIPEALSEQRISDADSAAAITFIHSHMVNCFKGAVTELLAARACLRLMHRLQHTGDIPQDARLYIGDSVGIHRTRAKGVLKGADLHILIEESKPYTSARISVVGIAEVKSYTRSQPRMRKQLDRHLQRLQRGIRILDVDYPAAQVGVGYGSDHRVVRIAVLPSNWKLPRSFRFEDTQSGHRLHVEPGTPPRDDDEIRRIARDDWRITLRWSKEALAEAAYEMTFWYMEKVGEVVYSTSVPQNWQAMSAAEAGKNAAKMMLYYAILRCRTVREEQRAVALYNTYAFGYALGMNYKDARGRREMLWSEDLEEILSSGKTSNGCSLH